jgi:LysM repeat protein
MLLTLFSVQAEASISILSADSIGVENYQGKEVVLHRLAAKETYYSLSRKYAVNPNDIIAFNSNKSLKIGDVVKVPTNRSYGAAAARNNAVTSVASAGDTPSTEYKVGRGETLFNISRRFQVSVARLVEFNNLSNEQDIKVGQVLRIPQGNALPQAQPQPEEETLAETVEAEPSRNSNVRENRYGLRQVDEKGVGVWMEGLNSDGNMLALHKTAPVGTVIKITNPMTQKSTFAKVVGKYNDNSNTRDAIVVISKATANLLGILDKRFLINISYGVPAN